MAHSSDTLLFSTPQSPDEIFSARFARCTREPETWEAEIYRAARSIANSTTKPLWLFMGGDIDSLVLVRAFRKIGYAFSVLIPEYADGANKHDIRHLTTWCYARQIPYKLLSVDLSRFFSDVAPRYAEQGYLSGSVQKYLQLLALETIENWGGYAILPGGTTLFSCNAQIEFPTRDNVIVEFDIGHAMFDRWCTKNGTGHEPYFFLHTPELCLAYTRLPQVAFALENPAILVHPDNPVLFKRLVLQSVFFYLYPQRRFVGFDTTLEIQSRVSAALKERFAIDDKVHALAATVMLQQLIPA